ncbi:hypothetical protein QK342_13990 [Myroides odoratimimus]|uniref:hypothetical protein n=1 Tax=Myroides odoratimimus TaxID=76832 RepID=UPI00103F6810|nr:hypothetical protein [Myroides odoratimimus]QBK77378.1 hypothetical protein E0Z07_13930 [Myroides odoratimimus]WHT72812.1 hypothetical protein QK342_13990 [Myroides odoratimimus]WHU37396.1 hypothetical protein QNM93_13985 [Myroides odoratimimus]
MKAEVTIKNNFYLYLHLNEDFKKAYNDLMNKSSLFIEFENDIAFMSEFQNEFSKTDTTPNVHKYLRLIYTEKQILSTIYKSHGIDSRGEYTPLESELDKRKNQLYKLINDSKEPKECYTHKIEETNIYKQFKAIEEILNRFKEMKGFDTSVDSLVKQAEEFGKGLISEIQNINYEPIRNRIIEVIIKDKENFNSYLNGYNNRNFKAQEFNDNYAKAKMYLNNYLKQILETKNQQVKTEKLDESKNINISLEDFLFNPSDKHKIPLIVEKFKNEKGKSMAIAIYLLKELNIFNYELNSKTKGRANLAIFLNPNIKMNGVNMHFTSNTYNLKSLYPDDLNQTKQWLNGL